MGDYFPASRPYPGRFFYSFTGERPGTLQEQLLTVAGGVYNLRSASYGGLTPAIRIMVVTRGGVKLRGDFTP
ncbi:hypothetical protein [Neomoorella thermoacetica]|uniref:hypothetical protein n=1 Tax=Neomoorella thermoacetica TaxID=1525 RepID=UPI00084CA736|nr:hypothetical protein [Moorella thermoacetica]